MARTAPHTLHPVTAEQTIVVLSSADDAEMLSDIVAAVTDEEEGCDTVSVVHVETVAAACDAIRGDGSGHVVVVGTEANAVVTALDVDGGVDSTVVPVPTTDDWEVSLSRCLQQLVTRGQEAQYVEQERDLLAISLDALDDVFYVYDAGSRLVRWNDRLNEVFGLTDAELAGLRPETFFVESSRERVRKAAAAALAGNEVVVEAEAETDAGRVRFELTGRPLADDDGTVVGFSGVARDVTCSRRNAERLVRENEALSAFGRVLTHDLRNPLGVAAGYLSNYREDHDSEELRRVARALDRMNDLIDEVRSSTGGAPLDLSSVPLGDVVRSAWEAVETRDALLVVDTQATVEADPRRLQRLLENLFGNCVDHAGEAPTVRVGDVHDGFFVADDGPGIPDELREDVFRTGFTTASDGTGYGLGIVRELAGVHGWRIHVPAENSDGARFEIRGVGLKTDGD